MSTVQAPGVVSTQKRRSTADVRARRILHVDNGPPRARYDEAHRIFGTSMVLSGTRCLLSYVILPFVAPLVGLATGVGAAIGIPIGILALIFDVKGIRRFWLADHAWRWPVTFVYLAVMLLVTVLVVQDVIRLA
ncbi:MAG TPA: hypothetical protein VEJ87_04820 [Acidimicrobiales bacterium]|nr:hypothetical protein [Acidimicrobiales bacterium]